MRCVIVTAVVSAMLLGACADGGSVPGTSATPPTAPTGVVFSPSEGVDRAAPDPSAPLDDLVSGLNDAGFDLWRSRQVDENIVFSPASIGHALLMARAAADLPTAAAIDDAFGLSDGLGPHRAWNLADGMITDSARAEDEIEVAIADRIWPRSDVTPDQAWIDLLAAQHGADVEALDFAGDPAGSRQAINSWVGDRTEGLIPQLLPEGFIDGQTVLILTDAVYFAARWGTPFGKYPEVTADFTRLDDSTVDTDYLHELELSDLRGSVDGFTGAEIPYAGGDFAMLLLVPDEGRFQEVRDRLSQDLLDEIDSTFTSGQYELLMPGWETNTTIDLIPWLTGLGIAPGAFPAISPAAFLDGGIHGADIAVDEWGTVAAAATALAFDESGPPQPEITLRADRPFFYLIRHRPSGLVLFAGQVTDPS